MTTQPLDIEAPTPAELADLLADLATSIAAGTTRLDNIMALGTLCMVLDRAADTIRGLLTHER